MSTNRKYLYGKRTGLACCLLLSLLLSGCRLSGESDIEQYIPPEASQADETEEPESVGMSEEDAAYASREYLETMSLEEKVGQLFVVNLELLDASKGNYYEHQRMTKAMKESLRKYPVGGVILFSRNIGKRKQTKRLIRKLQKNSQTPLFVAVDEEGGDVARIGSNPDMGTDTFPSMEEIGKTQDADYVYGMAETIGGQIRELGFNVDFAPVADVRTSDLNEEIGSRSFGDNPQKVAKLVSAYVKGLESQNVCSTLKHFPGQGSSEGDTHEGSVDIDSNIASLRKVDFVPFVSGMEAGADMVMVSHISVSKVTETSEPASLSELVMTTILREELGFRGIIVTDAFDMASIIEDYSVEEAVSESFEAGADIVLMPQELPEAYEAILERVKDGTCPEQRLDESVQRILQLKFQKGIMGLDDLSKKVANKS